MLLRSQWPCNNKTPLTGNMKGHQKLKVGEKEKKNIKLELNQG